MATIFSKIIQGEIPARFVWKDGACVAFLDSKPLKPGHTLLVPRQEVSNWIDLDLGTWEHLCRVAKAIGAGLQRAYAPEKVGMMLAGLQVPHAHIHLVPIWDEADLAFANADPDPGEEALDEAAQTVRTALREMGATEVPGD